MAASYLSPYIASDLRSIPEAVELLAESGHPVSRSTLERLCRKNGVRMTKYGRTNHASWTAMAKLHRDWVNARR
ncbi:hypothetical protein [Streptomyces olivaceoviridis]|uniref:hypothetical protein n=1 Tax=Streptomyces olivaceoviridis TaxID=1921 RepID=UPI0036FEA237